MVKILLKHGLYCILEILVVNSHSYLNKLKLFIGFFCLACPNTLRLQSYTSTI
jgi:hypothetical protein